jgi:hypothetical protein
VTGFERSTRQSVARPFSRCSCLVAVGLSLARPTFAQFHAGADALLATRYVWRGVERTNGIVLQPDVYLAYGLKGAGWITLGVWGNVELEHWSSTDFSDRPDRKPGLGERDAWAQLTRNVGGLDCTAGWVGYFRRADLTQGAVAGRYDTHEIYAALQPRSVYLSPRLAAWWDVSRIHGFYFEGSVDLPIMGAFRGKQFWAIYLTATAGLNTGQGPDRDRPSDPINFAGTGVTHLDLGAAFNLRGPWTDRWAATQIAAHLQFSRDPYTRRHSLAVGDDDHPVTVWLGLSLGMPTYHATGE